MATAEAAAGSLGPHYAPDDPTLPKPWKGLVDGNTGLLYYWNPETNITQYERPASSVPPLPPGPPPSASVPKLAPIPMAGNLPPNGTALQQGTQQIVQQAALPAQQQQQPSQHLFQQQQQQSSQQLPGQQPGPQALLPNAQQIPIQQPHHSTNQQMTQQQTSRQYMQIQSQHAPYQHVSYLQGPLLPSSQVQQQQGFQFSHQQGQEPQGPQMTYQPGQQPQSLQIPNQQHPKESLTLNQQGQQTHGLQIPLSQGLPILSQQTHHGLQVGQQQGRQSQGLQAGSQLVQQPQGQQPRFPWVEDALHQEGKQGSLSSSGIASSSHHLPGLVPQVSIPSVGGRPPQSPNQLGGSVQNVSSSQVGIDTSYGKQQQAGSAVPSPMGHPVVHPPIGGKVAYDEDEHEFYPSSRMERPMMYPHQPKLAAIPLPQRQPDGGIRPQFDLPSLSGGMSMGPQHALPNMYGRSAFPNSGILGPSQVGFGSSDFSDVSAADAYRQHHEVTAMGNDVPPPFMTFEATGFPPEILREMHLAGFSSPTPIQAQTWPVALLKRDIVAIAKTGSGKTLGYLIPAFIHLRRCRNNPQFGPTVLVLAPTRELASQIQDEAFKFGRSSRISCTCLYGGAPKGPQLKEIERGADIVIATPGRLNDFLEMKKISFCQVSLLVLDEADRMLDMGFEPQIRKIVNEIPPQRQTLMYTATWPKEVRKIASDLLRNPVQVNIGSVDELVANKSITQHVEVVTQMDKQRRLEQILRTQERGSKVIIFCSTKRQCDQLARSIGRTFGAASIHGDKSQGERDHVLYQFRTGRAPVLVATDVAARGLDIKDIRVVINYDFPTGIEDYVHRIGRTGRAGATGVSYTFFTDQDWKYATDLVKVLEGANQRVPPEIREMAGRGGPLLSRPRDGINRWDSGGGGGGGRWSAVGGRGMRDGPPGGFSGRGGRQDFYGGRGPRGRGFGGPGGPGGRGRHDRGPNDRYVNSDGRNRSDGRRGFGERGRERSYSRSPEMVRTWGYDRSRSASRSRSSSRSRSRSRSKSWSPRSRSRSRSQSQSRSYDRVKRRSGWDCRPSPVPAAATAPFATSGSEPPTAAATGGPCIVEPEPVAGHQGPAPVVGFEPGLPLSGDMSPMSPGQGNGSLYGNEPPEQT
ncbi:DEAD-box ATP-dependent RNA helicase 46-like [Musa acuminata AAA Group]|uniref:DEAD-box ATP-dependent RNA helicase 46-like n=1 Tax=Musa acuminata AAA Group TaxID=214697 RepID=UPI0031D3B905